MTGKKKHTDHYTKWAVFFCLPFLICYALFFIFPTIYSLFISMTDWDSLAGEANRHFVGLQNYITVFTRDKLFWKSLGNTFLFMVIYIPILILAGVLIALMLYKLNRFNRLFQTLNLLPYITTPVAIGVIFSFMFDWSTGFVNRALINMGIIDEGVNWLGNPGTARFVVILLIIWKNTGYYMLIYLAGLSTIPTEISEAAKVDGANSWQVFRHITMPFLRPITSFLIVTSVISGFQLFDEPYLLFSNVMGNLGGPQRSCLTAMMYFFDKTFKSSTQLGYGAAVSYGIFLIILVTSVAVARILRLGGNNE